MEFAVWLAEIHPCAFVAPASLPLEVDGVNGPDHVLNNLTPSLKRRENLDASFSCPQTGPVGPPGRWNEA